MRTDVIPVGARLGPAASFAALEFLRRLLHLCHRSRLIVVRWLNGLPNGARRFR
jgi:hypothetical protein